MSECHEHPRQDARYRAAIAKLTPDERGAYDMDEVAEKMADMVAVDVCVMQMRQAMLDLQMLRGDDDDDRSHRW